MNTVLWFAGVANTTNNFHKIKKICMHFNCSCPSHVWKGVIWDVFFYMRQLHFYWIWIWCVLIILVVKFKFCYLHYPTQYRQSENSSLNTCFVLWAWKCFLWIDLFQTQWYMNSCVMTLNTRILFVSNCQNFYGFFLTHNNLLYECVYLLLISTCSWF